MGIMRMSIISSRQYAVKSQTSLALLSWFRGSRVTTAHAHQCCIFQSYAKTMPSRMKLTMREPTFMGSMTTDKWSPRVTSDFNSVSHCVHKCNTIQLSSVCIATVFVPKVKSGDYSMLRTGHSQLKLYVWFNTWKQIYPRIFMPYFQKQYLPQDWMTFVMFLSNSLFSTHFVTATGNMKSEICTHNQPFSILS